MLLIRKITIKARLWSLILIAVIGIVAMSAFMIMQSRTELIEAEMKKLDAVNDVARGFVYDAYQRYKNGELGETEAMQNAIDRIDKIRYEGGEYIFIYGRDGMLIMDPSLPVEDRFNVNFFDFKDSEGTPLFQHMTERTQNSERATVNYVWELPDSTEIAPKMSRVITFDQWDWIIGTGVYMNHVADRLWSMFWRITGLVLLLSLPVMALFLVIVNSIINPLNNTISAMNNISEGDADLTRRLNERGKDELSQLARAFNAFIERIEGVMITIRQSSEAVKNASNEIASGGIDLSRRTKNAPSSIQQTSASMEEITSTVEHSTESARQADRLSKQAANKAREGGQAVHDVTATMIDITNAANQITEIVKMMDGIAFQTNILALNASVEAARAGEHGRGFAVVAEEVRKLANHSAEASRDIRTLIDNASGKIQTGSSHAENAGARMKEIVESVEHVATMLSEVVNAAEEQQDGIQQVNTAVSEMDRMTQENSSLVEESTTAAEQLKTQAMHLAEAISAFKVSLKIDVGQTMYLDSNPPIFRELQK